MSERQRVIVGSVTAYAVAIVTLLVGRLVLRSPAELQFLVPAAAWLSSLYVASVAWPTRWSRSGRRRGRRMLANAAVIFTALTLTTVLRASMPDDWPVLAVGLVLPLFSVAQIAIDWGPQPSPAA